MRGKLKSSRVQECELEHLNFQGTGWGYSDIVRSLEGLPAIIKIALSVAEQGNNAFSALNLYEVVVCITKYFPIVYYTRTFRQQRRIKSVLRL